MFDVVDADRMLENLVGNLLDQWWHKDCEIIPDYMPPYPSKDTRPRVIVKYKSNFLRLSAGPSQRPFWDIYGDDMQTVEWAIILLSQAPTPRIMQALIKVDNGGWCDYCQDFTSHLDRDCPKRPSKPL